MNLAAFRELTKRIIAAEKPGFWSDWTREQQDAYSSGDWRRFSRSRGYSESEMSEFAEWLDEIDSRSQAGLNPLDEIRDLTIAAALANIDKDTKGEIMKSSHFPHSTVLLSR